MLQMLIVLLISRTVSVDRRTEIYLYPDDNEADQVKSMYL